MKTSIEAAEATDEVVVRDTLARTFRREMRSEENLEVLIENACVLTWEWLEGLRSGVLLRNRKEGNLLLLPQGRYSYDKCDHLVVRVFTKEDEAAVDALFAKQ